MHYLHLKQIFKLCGELTHLIKVEPDALLNKHEQFITPESLQIQASSQAERQKDHLVEDHPVEDKPVEDNLSNAIESVDFRLLLGLCLFMLQQEPEFTTDVEVDVDTQSYFYHQDFWRTFKQINNALNDLFIHLCDKPEDLYAYIKKGDEYSRIFAERNSYKAHYSNFDDDSETDDEDESSEEGSFEDDSFEETDETNFDMETFIKFTSLTKQGQSRYIEQFDDKFDLYKRDENGYPTYELSESNWLKEMSMEENDDEYKCAGEDDVIH